MEQFQGKTHLLVILDKSGSMGVVQKETIGGFNAWLQSMKDTPGEATLTLTLFDTTFSTPIKAAEISKVNPLDDVRYRPSGNTALLDAVGTTLDEIGEGVAEDRYIVCITTDGEENASHRFTKEDIAAKVKAREEKGNWTFTYLSAGFNAFADAGSLGISAGNTQSYTSDPFGTVAAFKSSAMNMASLRETAMSSTQNFYQGQVSADPRQGGSGPSSVNPPAPVWPVGSFAQPSVPHAPVGPIGGYVMPTRPATPDTLWTSEDQDSSWVSK